MPQGVGYGPYAAAPPEDPLAGIGLQAPGGLPPMAPLPPPPGGAPQLQGGPAPGMPPVPMPPAMPGMGGAMPGMRMGQPMMDPLVQQVIAGKSDEEIARMIVEMRFKGQGGQGGAPPPGGGY